MFKNIFKRKLKDDSYTNLIAAGTKVNGGVTFSGILRVEGSIVGIGDIEGESCFIPQDDSDCLIVADGGSIFVPNIACFDLILGGNIRTDSIKSRGIIKILKSASIRDCVIFHNEIEVEPGATLHNVTLKNMKEMESQSVPATDE